MLLLAENIPYAKVNISQKTCRPYYNIIYITISYPVVKLLYLCV